MTIIFLTILGLMTLLALSFVLYPLLFLHKNVSVSSLYLPSYKTAFILLVIVPVFSVFYYGYKNGGIEFWQWLSEKQHAALVQTEMKKLGSLPNIIVALQQKLQQNPSSSQGWYLLGKLYLAQQQFQNASQAFEKANALKKNNPDIMLNYAQALFFANHNLLNSQIKTLISQVLIQQPDNVNAINLLGIGAYNEGNYQGALNYWEKLLGKFPAGSDDEKTLLLMISEAQKKLAR